MKVLVTGGAGFIGRWVVKRFLEEEADVWTLDNLSNGSPDNLAEFDGHPRFHGLIVGDVRDFDLMKTVFLERFDLCIHLAAQINVQESLDNPPLAFEVNALGTYHVLEAARTTATRTVLMGTCMVYDTAEAAAPISETHPVKPASPYAGSKLAAEYLAESYYRGLGLPVTVLRPFNTYGPFQKSNMEGGVVSIFVKRHLAGLPLLIYGDGLQTRDLLYVEDCAEFVVRASLNPKAIGRVINAGTGTDVTINDLALMVAGDASQIENVPHHHPQAEIARLCCDASLAHELLDWRPIVTLEEGIRRTTEWIAAAASGE